ncbi:c-type cytochrome [Rhodanobacter ginsengiterrae]|uniref:c-type cytochrome n=1 Tax=Rhodanobacter ginsengiterrae TaxID=2008451 RepID=UPI003CF15207
MSFRSAGFRPAVLGSALAVVFALSASAAMAQDAKPETAAPAAASTAAAAPAAPAVTAAEAPAKPGDAAAGQAKAAVCGACHGMDGNSADAQYPKLAGQSEQYIVRQLTSFKAAKRQNPIMMGMAAPLSTQDMHDVAAYFASKTPLPGVADQALVEHGQTLFRQGDATRGVPACMACHSIDGRGNPGAMYPQLTSQHAQYVEATLKSWHDGTTWGDDAHAQIMPAIAKQLTADDIAALASYIEGLHSAEPQPAATP